MRAFVASTPGCRGEPLDVLLAASVRRITVVTTVRLEKHLLPVREKRHQPRPRHAPLDEETDAILLLTRGGVESHHLPLEHREAQIALHRVSRDDLAVLAHGGTAHIERTLRAIPLHEHKRGARREGRSGGALVLARQLVEAPLVLGEFVRRFTGGKVRPLTRCRRSTHDRTLGGEHRLRLVNRWLDEVDRDTDDIRRS